MRHVHSFLALLPVAGVVVADAVTIPVSRKVLAASRAESYVSSAAASKAEVDVHLGTANIAYFANIYLGTPPVEFLALLDTGSSDLVVETAVQTSSCSGCITTGPLYKASDSSTAQVTTTPIVLTYGIGDNSGVAVTDVVSFGGFTQNQTFAACDINNQFSNIPSITGLLGLGLTPLAQSNATPFVEELWRAGHLDAPEFGMAFAYGGNNYRGTDLISGGFITLGGSNESFFTGNIEYYDVFDNGTSGYWAIGISNIGLNGVNAGVGTTAALIDSGTNGISLPSDLTEAIYSALGGSLDPGGSGIYLYPCSANPVNLSFTIEGKIWNMAPDTFVQQQFSDGTCTGAVRDGGSGPGSNLWILGSSFMENFYTSFRFSPPQVGFAVLSDPNNDLEDATIPDLTNGSSSPTITLSGSSSRTSSVRSPSSTSTPTGTASRSGSALGATVAVLLAVAFAVLFA